MSVELRQLEYFVAVAEELHFGRAAERLHVGQPAVSQQLARLERELGVELVERTSRRVRLTAAGHRLLPASRTALLAIDRLRDLAREPADQVTGTLRLGTSEGLGERLDRVLEQLSRVAPRLQIQLVSLPFSQRIAAVREERLDAAFVRPAITDPDGNLEQFPVWTEPLVAALPATHPLAARPAIQLKQIARLPLRLTARETNPRFHDLITTGLERAGIEPSWGNPIDAVHDALSEIGSGAPAWSVLYASAAEQLSIRRIAFRRLDLPHAQTALITKAGHGPALKTLIDTCLAVA
ncbi:LysR family transcriptional regulator [Actinomadura rupiterrae]|uniref:LysR family transcriptional regulator n=1 Tax=Actinomadura rupiterrae TaxID=559627 RepID=UPI0020A32380|nr:LysR family transcriptional regulator [Actinomadura rupiterrae]MCP2339315.1 DNA-binding transcriptional LysR family regulator [Actinomadura rupiterrae]